MAMRFFQEDDPVWYLAYGSNMLEERFCCYIEGGRPDGASRAYPGARDRTFPSEWKPVMLSRRLVFAGESQVWGGGGVAFLGRHDPDAGLPARAWLVTVGQLCDLVAQENGHEPGTVDATPLLYAVSEGASTACTGKYGMVQTLGTDSEDGRFRFMFTSPRRAALKPNRPSDAYLSTIVRGCVETHGFCEQEAAKHYESSLAASSG